MQNLNIIYKAVLYSAILSIISCNNLEESSSFTSSDIEQIDVAKALESSKPINASILGIESFEYIPLETNENTLMLTNPYLVSTIDDLLVVKNYKKLALFNKNGEYISDIGKYGEDPGAYRVVITSVNDRLDQRLVSAYSKFSKEILEFSVDTKQLVNTINIQNVLLNNDSTLHPSNSRFFDVFFEDKENIWGFLPNLFGDTPYRLIKFNEDGVIKKAYPQGQTIKERPDSERLYFAEAIFYKIRETLMFKERYSDTLFIVNDEHLNPKYVFNLAEKSPPYEEKNYHRFASKEDYDWGNFPYPYIDRNEYIFIESLIECDDFLIFSIMYHKELSYGLYDKKNETTQISKIPDDISNGFYNDIDDFLPFRPTFIDRESNKLVGFVTAEEVLNWFEKNPELASKLPEELADLSQIQPEDNPVVMIGKFKND